VTFSSALANANYNVAVTFTADKDFGSHMDDYMYVTNKTTTGFTIVFNSSGGNAHNAPSGTTVDWIATPTN
jgi:hypothetical protein